jgi:hypothetical protein
MPTTLSNLASGFFGGFNGQVAPQLAGLAFGALPGMLPGVSNMLSHAMIQGPSPQFTFGRDGAAAQLAAALGLEKSGIDTTDGTSFGDMNVSGGSVPEGGKGDTVGGGAKGEVGGAGGWSGDAPGWGGGYDPGLYAKGGKVRPNPESPNPPGEDDQMIGAETGEGILTREAMKRYPGLLAAANSAKTAAFIRKVWDLVFVLFRSHSCIDSLRWSFAHSMRGHTAKPLSFFSRLSYCRLSSANILSVSLTA